MGFLQSCNFPEQGNDKQDLYFFSPAATLALYLNTSQRALCQLSYAPTSCVT